MADWLCSATEISLRKTASTTKMSATKCLIAYLFPFPEREPVETSGDILPRPTGSLLLLMGDPRAPDCHPAAWHLLILLVYPLHLLWLLWDSKACFP